MQRIAIVTGAAQGIGRATVEYLLKRQWRVAALDHDAEAVAEMGDSASEALLPLTADVGREADVEAALGRVAAWTGYAAPVCDLLLNNAAIADPVSGPIENLSLGDWNRRMDSCLTAAFLCTRTATPWLRRRRGSIVNIASTRALQSEPNTEAYAACKGALVALTHALAISLGPEVRVNAISPGWIEVGSWKKRSERRSPGHRPVDAAQHPVGRIGQPDDIAALIDYLASPAAAFITGQNFVVDGGMTRKMIYAE
jgi:NAD(P)-dependent dehydrogenase (short-subunit alcohol dehydrogenase family)